MSQNNQILAHMRKNGGITALEAFGLSDLHCCRLSARIFELRERGHNIGDVWVERGGKKFKRYFLVAE